MSEYNEGDMVEAVKGETVIRGRLRAPEIDNPEAGLFWVGDSGCLLNGMFLLGFTVTVIERTKPALPHGTLLFATGHVARWRNDILGWSITGSDRAWGDPSEIVKLFGSEFTRLEPVAETAKKVLDAVAEYLDGQLSGRTKNDIIKFIADEFGVTS